MMIEKSVKKTEKKALDGLDKKDRKALYKLLKRIEGNLSLEDKDDDDKADDAEADDEGAEADAGDKVSA